MNALGIGYAALRLAVGLMGRVQLGDPVLRLAVDLMGRVQPFAMPQGVLGDPVRKLAAGWEWV